MKLVPCPLNGLRPADEFVHGGEVRATPEPATCSDVEWARHVFHRSGVPGVKREWW
jgi:sarcosine oxidase subunit delta